MLLRAFKKDRIDTVLSSIIPVAVSSLNLSVCQYYSDKHLELCGLDKCTYGTCSSVKFGIPVPFIWYNLQVLAKLYKSREATYHPWIKHKGMDI